MCNACCRSLPSLGEGALRWRVHQDRHTPPAQNGIHVSRLLTVRPALRVFLAFLIQVLDHLLEDEEVRASVTCQLDAVAVVPLDRKSTRLNSSQATSRMPSSA